MTFILRTWAYFCLFAVTVTPTLNKFVSLASLALIVSSQSLVLTTSRSPTRSLQFAQVIFLVSFCLILISPDGHAAKIVSSTPSSVEARNEKGTPFSNITLLDLYPELKDYLWKKALSQMIVPTTPKTVISLTEGPSYYGDYNNGQQHLPEQYNTVSGQNGWGWGTDYGNGYYGTLSGAMPEVTQGNNVGGLPVMPSGTGGGIMGVGGAGNSLGQWNSRESNLDSDTQSSYNYQKEVLKHWHPFGSPEFYDSWKFKPTPPISLQKHHPPASSFGWSSLFPFWEEEEESQVTHELSKDFSCLAGLLGLKTLKTLKFAVIFKKLKMFAIFFIAFKLGVLLSPVAIPLLFPIIILVTVVKVLPLILIIVLLLKILKKQVKIKKPFGKYLESTGSLFFDDVEYVTDKVINSDDEFIDKLATGLQQKKSVRRSKSKSIKDSNSNSTDVKVTTVGAKKAKSKKRVNSRMLS